MVAQRVAHCQNQGLWFGWFLGSSVPTLGDEDGSFLHYKHFKERKTSSIKILSSTTHLLSQTQISALKNKIKIPLLNFSSAQWLQRVLNHEFCIYFTLNTLTTSGTITVNGLYDKIVWAKYIRKCSDSKFTRGRATVSNGRRRCSSYLQTSVIRVPDTMGIHNHLHICSLCSQKTTYIKWMIMISHTIANKAR